jgi:hypothetical protein
MWWFAKARKRISQIAARSGLLNESWSVFATEDVKTSSTSKRRVAPARVALYAHAHCPAFHQCLT